jgi:hypothetical protein
MLCKGADKLKIKTMICGSEYRQVQKRDNALEKK